MGLTMCEKILANHAGKESAVPGEIVNINIDLTLVKMATHGLWAYETVEKLGAKKVFDPEKVVMYDTGAYFPEPMYKCAKLADKLGVAKSHRYRYKGIFHHNVMEDGYIVPGMTFAATDSHTTVEGILGCFSIGLGSKDIGVILATGKTWIKVPETMKIQINGSFNKWVTPFDFMLNLAREEGLSFGIDRTVEFDGPTVKKMSIDARITLGILSLDIGNPISVMIEPDEVTMDFLSGRTKKNFKVVKNDPDCNFAKILEKDVSELEPMVACPHNQANSKPAHQVKGVKINQAIIGACASSRLDDLKLAAKILEGRKIDSSVRLLIVPGTQNVFREIVKEGLDKIFVEAGAQIGEPSCRPCIGQDAQQLPGDVTITSGSRNHRGRLQCYEADIYLGNPATVAASAVAGKIIDPRDL